MFKKKKQPGLLPGQDTHQLLEAMDKIANGNFEEADVTQFKNPVYAEKINAMQCCTHLRMPIIRL